MADNKFGDNTVKIFTKTFDKGGGMLYNVIATK